MEKPKKQADAGVEYTVRVPKTVKKKYNVMRFHTALGVDFKAWNHTKMERENNMKEFKTQDEEIPKFGAGSEYGRDMREEARRKKYGIHLKKYKPEDQPWILSEGGKSGRKYKGIREGGVADNSSWYVFMQGKDGAFEAYPVEEWYKFNLIPKYKALNAEEAEKEFERRDKIMNYFSVMVQKKCNKGGGGDDVEEAEDATKKKGKAAKNLLLSEMDDWMSDNETDGSDEDLDDDEKEKKKKKKNKVQAKGRTQKGGKKKKSQDGDSDDDCLEESDEFDDGAEHDYISSDSSDSEAENEEVVRKELAGVDEDDALKKLLNSDEDDEEEKEKEKEEDEEKKEGEEKEEKEKKKKKKKKEKKKEQESDGKSSDSSEDESNKKKKKGSDKSSKKKDDDGGGKRKLSKNSDADSVPKKARTDTPAGGASGPLVPQGSDSGVTEEAIRRYLMRKPMTTTELLQKFKCKKTGLNSDQLVQLIAQILKRINPVKQMVKGKMYLSIKS